MKGVINILCETHIIKRFVERQTIATIYNQFPMSREINQRTLHLVPITKPWVIR